MILAGLFYLLQNKNGIFVGSTFEGSASLPQDLASSRVIDEKTRPRDAREMGCGASAVHPDPAAPQRSPSKRTEVVVTKMHQLDFLRMDQIGPVKIYIYI